MRCYRSYIQSRRNTHIEMVLFAVILVILSFLLIGSIFGKTPFICHHEVMGRRFSFGLPNAQNPIPRYTIHPYCTNCNHFFGYTERAGIPDDKAYLDVMNDGKPFVSDETYTITAEVSMPYFEANNKLYITCSMEDDNIIVSFPVWFANEEQEHVELLERGDIITFCGVCNLEGCYWTNCGLLNVESKQSTIDG